MPSAALAAALPWLLPFAVMPRLAKKTPNLADTPPATGVPLSVIIPARNESGQIERVVRSVLASAYAPLEVVVVDDRSTDDTAARVRALAAADARVRLVEGRELPRGWYGKPWACAQGAAAATGEVLVFTDADTVHGPELLGRAVAMQRAMGADLLTVAPKQLIVSFWERLVMPQVWVMLGLRYHPDTVNAATRPRQAIANGQFILFTRESYARIGTHEAVAGEVVEDLALAQRAVRLGLRLRFVFAEQYMETRMYTNLAELVEGWSKNIYLGGRLSFPDEPLRRATAPLLMAGNLLFWLLPVAALAAALAGAAPALFWPALVAWLASSGFWALISFGMGAPMAYGWGYPLGAATALWILIRSTVRGARKVEWRGRVYDETTATVTETRRAAQ